MSDDFNASDWYWIVGGDESRVWSSARGRYYAVGNDVYRDWLREGRLPTRIASEAELADVLQVYGLSGPAVPTRYTIPKQLPFLRATDQEAEQIEAAIQASGARLRNVYAGATHLDTADPLFPMVQGVLEQIVGEARAAELLAPEAT